jgi:3-hydroxy-D-aspartate aldolase
MSDILIPSVPQPRDGSMVGPVQPPFNVETPCFVVLEEVVMRNFWRTTRIAGGVERLMSHVKTHRAAWLIERMVAQGATAFKVATPAELELAVRAGGRYVVWAYPTTNVAAVRRVVQFAAQHPDVRIEALVDSAKGLETWHAELGEQNCVQIGLRVDLDPDFGRTGLPIGEPALQMAQELKKLKLFAGWHCYDGHIGGPERQDRVQRVGYIVEKMRKFLEQARADDLNGDLIAGGSYSFDLWPNDVARWVSPGSWVYSSSRHHADLPEFEWEIGAYVLSTVLSVRDGTATLDAGSKAISPDVTVNLRFQGPGSILMMKEEHTVIKNADLAAGQQVALIPGHACTAAYLYPKALVLGEDGVWAYREQLSAAR